MGNYENWKEEYYKKEKVDLKQYFSEMDFELLKKMNISILDKIYTENEFEQLYSRILNFYNTDSDEPKNLIINKNVTREEIDYILKKIEEINAKYDF